jgi:hypothetical protein
MPRKARLDFPEALHNVMVRIIEGRNILRDEEDRKPFVIRVRALAKDSRVKIGESAKGGVVPTEENVFLFLLRTGDSDGRDRSSSWSWDNRGGHDSERNKYEKITESNEERPFSLFFVFL